MDYLGMDSGLEQGCSVRMAKLVHRDRRQVGVRDEPAQPLARPLRVDWLPDLIGEQPLSVLEVLQGDLHVLLRFSHC